MRAGAPDAALTPDAGMAAISELCDRLDVTGALDAAVGPVKQRDRGFGAGELLAGIAVRVWDLAGTADPRVLDGRAGPVRGVAVSADGHTAVSGSSDGTVRVWDLTDDSEQARWTADSEVTAVALNTAVIAVGDMAGQVHALRLNVPTAASA